MTEIEQIALNWNEKWSKYCSPFLEFGLTEVNHLKIHRKDLNYYK